MSDWAGIPATHESSGVDWLTLTFPSADLDDQATKLRTELLEERADLGDEVKTWKGLGYQGIQVTGFRMGVRADGALIQVSGEVARSTAKRWQTTSGRATRLDLQTTLRLQSSIPSFGSCVLPYTSTTPRRRGPPQKRSVTRDSAGSFMASVGSRSSPRYLRVYDKGVESGAEQPGILWRAELELKGDLCRTVYEQASRLEQEQSYYSSLLLSSLRQAGGQWPIESETISELPTQRSAPPSSDADRALAYLRKYCRKMAIRANEQYSSATIMEALGIRPYFMSHPPRLNAASRNRAED